MSRLPLIVFPFLFATTALATTDLTAQRLLDRETDLVSAPTRLGAPVTPTLRSERKESLRLDSRLFLGLRSPERPRLQEAAKKESPPLWKSSANIGAMVTSGNTRRRTADFAVEAVRREGDHRTTIKGNWNYAQQKADADANYKLDQRRVIGSVKQDRFLSEKSYLFANLEGENDYSKNISLRYNATVGIGLQLFEAKASSLSVEAGIGFVSEQSRLAGTADKENTAGRVSFEYSKQLNETVQLLCSGKYYPSLETDDNFYGSVDTRLRASVAEGMFAQLQYVLDYNNEPASDAQGNPNNRMDHQLLLSVGWAF